MRSREAAAICDHTLVVSDTNKEAFVAGHRDAGLEARLVTVPNRAEAFRWIRETFKEGDVVKQGDPLYRVAAARRLGLIA